MILQLCRRGGLGGDTKTMEQLYVSVRFEYVYRCNPVQADENECSLKGTIRKGNIFAAVVAAVVKVWVEQPRAAAGSNGRAYNYRAAQH